jgi:hypothetical protein
MNKKIRIKKMLLFIIIRDLQILQIKIQIKNIEII